MGIVSFAILWGSWGVWAGAMDACENDVLVVFIPSDSLGCLVVVYPIGLLSIPWLTFLYK